MRAWLGKVVTLVSGAAFVYACAGKSIRTDGDGASNDEGDGFGATGTSGGRGGTTGTTGKGGSATGKGGSATGKGGAGGTITTGGKGGAGGTVGTGGFGGTLGKGGTAGTSVGGDDSGGVGGDECGPRRDSGFLDKCDAPVQCIALANPTQPFVRLNQPASDDGEGGAGGEGGSSDGARHAATARLCGVTADQSYGFLAFDYRAPATGISSIYLVSGLVECGGTYFGSALTQTYRPQPGSWTTQCVPIQGIDLDRTVTVRLSETPADGTAQVRNLRFATGCECPLSVTRYTTCGDLRGPLVCR